MLDDCLYEIIVALHFLIKYVPYSMEQQFMEMTLLKPRTCFSHDEQVIKCRFKFSPETADVTEAAWFTHRQS